MNKLIALSAAALMASSASIAAVSLTGTASVTFDDNGASANTTVGAASVTISGSNGASSASASLNLSTESVNDLTGQQLTQIEALAESEAAISSMASELNDSQAQVGLLINQLASKNSELAKDKIRERTLNTQLKEMKDELTNQLTLMSVTLLFLLAFTVIFGFMITDAIKKSIKYIY